MFAYKNHLVWSLALLTLGCGGEAPSADKAAPPRVITDTLPDAVQGERYSVSLEATGGVVSEDGYRWSLYAGELPEGLYLSSRGSPGVLSGEPKAVGSYRFSVRIEDANGGFAKQELNLRVAPAPVALNVITTALSDADKGVPYAATLTAQGGAGDYRWSVSVGALPPGLSLAEQGTPSAQLSGVPTEVGTFNFSVQVKDKAGATAEQAFALKIADVQAPLKIQTRAIDLPDGVANRAYRAQVRACCGSGEGYQWTVSQGSLPEGLSLTAEGAVATLSGAVRQAGNYGFSLQVEDSAGATDHRRFDLYFDDPPPELRIITYTLPDGLEGDVYREAIQAAHGTAPYQWSVTGPLPPGLRLQGTGDEQTTYLTGVPTTPGDFSFSLTVKDAAGADNSVSFTVKIASIAHALAIQGAPANHSGVRGQALAPISLVAVGGDNASYGWTLSGAPAGVSIGAQGGNTQISGIPAVAGEFDLLVTLFDAQNATTTANIHLSVAD